MGNQLSCISSLSTAIAVNAIRYSDINPSITILNVVNGRACLVAEPLTVGELMLEFPGQCVVEFSAHIRIDMGVPSHNIMEQGSHLSTEKRRRIVALPADQNLCANHLYLMVPLQRSETRLSADELQVINAAAARVVRSTVSAHMSSSRIMPLPARQCEEAARIRREDAASQGLSRIAELLGGLGQEEAERSNGDEGMHTFTTLKNGRARTWTPKLDTIAESLPLD